MKPALPCLFALCLPFWVAGQANPPVISITNSSTLARQHVVVAIPWQTVLQKHPGVDTAQFGVVNRTTRQNVPFQFEGNGQPTVQQLLVQVSVPANGQIELVIEDRKSTPAVAKTYARYVPERLDDFAWENDKVAFRMYGKALEGTKGDAYGMDVWVKRTDKLVLNDRYKRGKYHEDIGDGMDYYHVGYTLGAGNVAPYVNDSVYYSANYHRWKILDNGPIRTTFVLEYDAWDVNGMPVTATKKITLDAGSQMNRVEATYRYDGPATLPVVIGIIKRPRPGTLLLDEQTGVMGYWEPEFGPDGITGVGTVIGTPIDAITVTKEQLLAKTIAPRNAPFVYYTGAAWNKAGLITTAPAWFAYLYAFKKALDTPLAVSVR